MQDCSNSIAIAMELLQSCTKQSIYSITEHGGANGEMIQGSQLNKPWFFGRHWHSTCQHYGQITATVLYIDGLVQDCSNSSALAMELLQSCTKPSICAWLEIKLLQPLHVHNYVMLDILVCGRLYIHEVRYHTGAGVSSSEYHNFAIIIANAV